MGKAYSRAIPARRLLIVGMLNFRFVSLGLGQVAATGRAELPLNVRITGWQKVSGLTLDLSSGGSGCALRWGLHRPNRRIMLHLWRTFPLAGNWPQ